MSVNFNRRELEFCQTSKEYKCKLLLDDPYLDECWSVHYSKNAPYYYGHKRSGKDLYQYQYRMYRTWKYNRRKQYKLK